MRALGDERIQNSETVGRFSFAHLEQRIVAGPRTRLRGGLHLLEGLVQRDHRSVEPAVSKRGSGRRLIQPSRLALQPSAVCSHAGVMRPGSAVVVHHRSVELTDLGVVLVDGLPPARLRLAKLTLELRSADSTGHEVTVACTRRGSAHLPDGREGTGRNNLSLAGGSDRGRGLARLDLTRITSL